jgi:hypothetical protein
MCAGMPDGIYERLNGNQPDLMKWELISNDLHENITICVIYDYNIIKFILRKILA